MILFTPHDSTKNHYPRVTQILSGTYSLTKRKALRDWKIRVGSDKSKQIQEDALSRGSHFHAQPEALWRKDPTVKVSPSIIQFLEDWEIEMVLCETNVYHDELKYRGRLDMLYRRQRKNGILDWKTSHSPRPLSYFSDYKSQISAYAKGMEFQHKGLEVSEAMIVLAYPKPSANPFVVEWGFQVVEMNQTALKRSFTRFKKKIVQFNEQNLKPLPPPPFVKAEPMVFCGNPF